MQTDLVAFLRARLDEDQRTATPGRQALDDLRFELKRGDPYEQHLSSRIEDGLDAQTSVWEKRMLREVAAKRAILEAHRPYDTVDGPPDRRCYVCASDHAYKSGAAIQEPWPCPTLLALAAVYSDHKDYDPAWVV